MEFFPGSVCSYTVIEPMFLCVMFALFCHQDEFENAAAVVEGKENEYEGLKRQRQPPTFSHGTARKKLKEGEGQGRGELAAWQQKPNTVK